MASSTAMACATLFTPSMAKPSNVKTAKLTISNTTTKLRSKSTVTDKLNGLASEFTSLSHPIDRVKRLLHYASLLPPLHDSDRVPANRVAGCTTQVWLVAEMDESGRMRFRADSDSEISKGFCWCLVWMFDGAEPEEVLMVQKDHLAGVNVGLHVKAQSRVNTWHNVLFRMQKATQDLLFLSPQNAIATPNPTPLPKM
ncbi:sufE-like protein 2, chloroplastic [Abrus precatorius]|uniref:SufE-like protein 2, chloroplastic n=1 Tax=Abrus precatorius TaxID=3816 RepID=A0A8B8K3F4_ABRPR|nr:sufE-like protein 2, chloroplastic [Abrus precatorius]